MAINRSLTPDERKFLQGNPGAANAELFRRATKRDEAIRQRLGTRKDQRYRAKHLPQLRNIILHVLLQTHVRAMKRNHTRFLPVIDERQQMHASMTEVN